MGFVERLKKIVDSDFDSQNDFARNIGVSGVTISTYTSGKQRPKYDILEKVYNQGYSIDWLISGRGSMKRQFFNDSEADDYDKEVLKSLYNDIADSEFSIGSQWLSDTSSAEPLHKVYKDFEKSISVQRALYSNYSADALFSKIMYSEFGSRVKEVVTLKSYARVLDQKPKKIKTNDGKIEFIINKSKTEVINKRITITDVTNSKDKLELEVKEGVNFDIEKSYKDLTALIYLLNEHFEYTEFLRKSNIKEIVTNSMNDNVFEYETSFNSIKSYFKSQMDLVSNVELVKTKSQILNFAVRNSFKFVE